MTTHLSIHVTPSLNPSPRTYLCHKAAQTVCFGIFIKLFQASAAARAADVLAVLAEKLA